VEEQDAEFCFMVAAIGVAAAYLSWIVVSVWTMESLPK